MTDQTASNCAGEAEVVRYESRGPTAVITSMS